MAPQGGSQERRAVTQCRCSQGPSDYTWGQTGGRKARKEAVAMVQAEDEADMTRKGVGWGQWAEKGKIRDRKSVV